MRLRFKKIKKGWYRAAILRGQGGVSSLIISREAPFWSAISVFFSIKYLWRGLTWKELMKKEA